MKSQVKSILVVFFLSTLTCFHVKGQKVENLDVQVYDDKAVIQYDLLGVNTNQEVEVRVFATIKGYDMRLYRASGDVGKGITGGAGKTIVWNNDEELTSYKKEDITFKISLISKQPSKTEKTKSKGIFAGITSIFVD